MSARLGNPQEQVIVGAALGASTGRVIPFNNTGWLIFVSGCFLYTASATAGSRQVSFDFRDSAGSLLFRAATQAAITTTQAARINLGAMTSSSITAPLVQNVSTPDGMSLPPNSTLTVVDTANIDTNDTVGGAMVTSN